MLFFGPRSLGSKMCRNCWGNSWIHACPPPPKKKNSIRHSYPSGQLQVLNQESTCFFFMREVLNYYRLSRETSQRTCATTLSKNARLKCRADILFRTTEYVICFCPPAFLLAVFVCKWFWRWANFYDFPPKASSMSTFSSNASVLPPHRTLLS